MNLAVTPISIDREVRHLSGDSVLDAVSISNVTRQLSARDYSIAQAVNDILTALKAYEQLVPITLPVVSLQPYSNSRIASYRIPTGYKASIINAAVSTLPVAGTVKFNIMYSAGTYGQTGLGNSAVSLVSTLSEYAVSGEFVGEGELIFMLEETSGGRAVATASATLCITAV